MSETHSLYIDDDEQDLGRGVAWQLETAFSEAFESAELKIDPASFGEGEEALRKDPDAYEIVFVDIMDEDEKERGLTIINRLAGDSEAVIVAISEFPAPLERARTQGAHAAISKERLNREPGYGAERLKEAFKNAKRTPPVALPAKISWDETKLQLEATVRSIGEENLQWLLARLCTNTPNEVKLRFVRAGLSGALVLHCHCEVEGASNEDFLLKASRDEEAARAEFEAWQKIPPTLRFLFPTAPKDIADSDGWHAMAVDYRAGITLTDWLTGEEPAEDRVISTLERLFLNGGLSTQYAESVETRDESALAVMRDDNSLNLGRRARVLAAKDDLLPLVERYLGEAEEISTAVDRLLYDGQLPDRGRETLPQGSCTAISHGDLHGRNVVVGEPQPAILIDPANLVAIHPASDWARLAVDVLTTGFAAREDGHDWAELAKWREAVAGFVAGVPLDDSLLRPGSIAAANWLRLGTEQVFAPLEKQAPAEWELRLALAFELLRATPRTWILPAPVRVLALVAAVDALAAAATVAAPKGGA